MYIPVVILAIIQGMAELLPISSSAHVIVAEKLLGLDPTSPEMTLLLVMLHTGTMLAVIMYFWKDWQRAYFSSSEATWRNAKLLLLATVLTGIIGMAIKTAIERHLALHNAPKAEIEMLFGNLLLIGIALAAAGILIVYAGLRHHRTASRQDMPVEIKHAAWMGCVQGLCLPFRGFSRSGATISGGMMTGASRRPVEEFSFAMAVVLTPPVLVREILRLLKHQAATASGTGLSLSMFAPGLLGLVCSFLAGLLALRWLSSWLERGRWHYFGYYCLFAATVVLALHTFGY